MTDEKKPGRVDQVMQDLRQMIRDEGLKVGDAMPAEQTIASGLGVSRNVVREAMRALAALGVVEVGNGRRARVAGVSPTAMATLLDHAAYTGELTLQQMMDVRRTLEIRASALAALRRSEAQARRMTEIAEAMLAGIDGDPDEIRELDVALHTEIGAASGNALFALLIESYGAITRRIWEIGWQARASRENRLENLHCHARLAAAIAARDSVQAERVMTEHFDSAIAALVRAGVT
ncbi:FadR/GntR family transcriptional regulator [Salipiger abyssi]|uniref:FadR/GntR family transcriptional regulator n=1 Tax=Salipiger abyssi TaxID=1250539 RepID=UPI004058D832